ncbi:metal-sensing transcriptional repressor [Sorangium sp. So ce341]|uniref:metal-sensing transcriptional repressor n=1 Tax=Sorangium sp. So ce341 TaxID=3133302 RepID=UPI003F61FC9E
MARVRRIRGQLAAVERAPDGDLGCAEALQTVTFARGALDGLMRGSSRVISGWSAVAS